MPHLLGQVVVIAPPYCPRLGIPFAYDPGPGILSMQAIADPPAYSRARAAVRYDDVARKLVHAFKYGDRLDLSPLLGRWMTRAGCELFDGADALVPVPLHWRRLAKRRYNQAAVLAHAIAKKHKLRVDTASLQRPRASISQGEMPSARARLKNVARAFTVSDAQKERIRGRRILLVDDVLTTGATLNACAKALKRAGAASVSAVTLARVVRPLSPSL